MVTEDKVIPDRNPLTAHVIHAAGFYVHRDGKQTAVLQVVEKRTRILSSAGCRQPPRGLAGKLGRGGLGARTFQTRPGLSHKEDRQLYTPEDAQT